MPHNVLVGYARGAHSLLATSAPDWGVYMNYGTSVAGITDFLGVLLRAVIVGLVRLFLRLCCVLRPRRGGRRGSGVGLRRCRRFGVPLGSGGRLGPIEDRNSSFALLVAAARRRRGRRSRGRVVQPRRVATATRRRHASTVVVAVAPAHARDHRGVRGVS